MLRFTRSALLCAALAAFNAGAAETPTFGPELQGFHYPYPLQQFSFTSQGQPLKMGYMDVPPEGAANGHTALLLHGKNFCAATWQDTIKALSKAGYRVIAPDQIGFCSSSKPAHYQYSFQQLAQNTHGLLQNLNISKAIVIGHSTGGMLATRYSLMYPQAVERLVMVNPIGLEDWKAKGVPWRSIDQWFARELNTSAESIRNYELHTYYGGRWKPEYDRWVDMLAGLNNGGPPSGGVELGADLRHDLHSAGVLRVQGSADAHHADDRHRRHHRHRQRYRPAVSQGQNRALRGAGQTGGKTHPARHADRVRRAGSCAANGGTSALPSGVAQGAATLSGRLARPPHGG
ncbi:alpha/beta fold hydrolase [Serratia marcescens]